MIDLPFQIKPKLIPKNIPRCFKCQGYGHTSASYTNRSVITLAKWETIWKEEDKEGFVEKEHEEKERFKEVVE